jgi:hypothetical protein
VPKSLWLKLVLPLALVSALSLLLHFRWDGDGFFINLITELIGIVVTVVYIDWVLRRHEAERWKGTDERIQERLTKFVFLLLHHLTTVLGLGPDAWDQEVVQRITGGDTSLAAAENRRVAEKVLRPALGTRLERLDVEGWRTMAEGLRDVWRGAGDLLAAYCGRLEPTRHELLLDVKEHVQSALWFWRTSPELVGKPDERLSEQSKKERRLGYDETAAALDELLEHACKLLPDVE